MLSKELCSRQHFDDFNKRKVNEEEETACLWSSQLRNLSSTSINKNQITSYEMQATKASRETQQR